MTEVLLSVSQFSGKMKGLKLFVLFGGDYEKRYSGVI